MNKLTEAKAIVNAIFSDDSLRLSQTKDMLEELQEYIDGCIDAIDVTEDQDG